MRRKASKPNGPIRRSQLIAPFGPGAMITVPGGTSLVIAGLDFWFPNDGDKNQDYDPDEFGFREWRLQRLIKVGHFRLPPDYREPGWGQKNIPNIRMTIPAFRFPAWHFCPYCDLLQEISTKKQSRVICDECKAKRGKTSYMYQVPFVAICAQGHLQDFPWREWVHETSNPKCNGNLRLISTGSATLAGQRVKCNKCKANRTLRGITQEGAITNQLDSAGNAYWCKGKRVWLDDLDGEGCSQSLKGSLRSAANIYYAHVYSSIFLPSSLTNTDVEKITRIFQDDVVIGSMLSQMTQITSVSAEIVLPALEAQEALRGFSKTDLREAYNLYLDGKPQDINESTVITEDAQTEFRRAEYNVLRNDQDTKDLIIYEGDQTEYSGSVREKFSRIKLIAKLRETRALAGFSRVIPDNGLPIEQLQELLWRDLPQTFSQRWLPAYKVYGEGIFLELDSDALEQWEVRPDVKKRIDPLANRYNSLAQQKGFRPRKISPRFVLVHTLAHLLINRLTFDCGYSSASLRERLYISENPKQPMAGLLIYTAAGDSEGTMGGLVRMGKPNYFDNVLKRALEEAQWCSADPVCMEVGESGQGPEATNLAACHNCALVPETACEEFNHFLDRGVVVGTLANPDLGFFNQ